MPLIVSMHFLQQPLRRIRQFKAHIKVSDFPSRPQFQFQVTLTYRQYSMDATIVNPPRDPNTLSNYNAFRTTRTTVNFDILFDKQQLTGNVIHQLKSLTNSESREVILDSSFLNIHHVKVDGKQNKFELLPRQEPYGSALKIPLAEGVALGKTVDIDISVETTEKCTALQWLTPAQTSTQKHPYMCEHLLFSWVHDLK